MTNKRESDRSNAPIPILHSPFSILFAILKPIQLIFPMAKKGGKKSEVIDNPFAVTYALAFLLALSILALVSVTLNCSSRTVLIDSETGQVINGSGPVVTE